MLKQVCLFLALVAALVHSAPVEETFKELPCLNKVAGQRLPHPRNPHQFLRCVTADTVWIETCPDNLFYNPHSEICDWDQVEKSTTTKLPDIIRSRPVLVKFRPNGASFGQSAARMETTVIEDVASELVNTFRPDVVLTTTPESTRISVAAEQTTVASTVVVETVSPITPAMDVVVVDESTTTVVPEVAVVEPSTPESVVEQVTVADVVSVTTTPRAEFVAPMEIVEAFTQRDESVSVTTTPRAEFVAPIEIVEASTQRVESVSVTTPVLDVVVMSTTVAPVQTVAPISVEQVQVPVVQQVPVVVSTTPVVPAARVAVVESTTEFLPVVEMSTNAF